FEFRPQAKVWLAANDAPRVAYDDTGMWRRIRLVPFEAVIAPERRNPEIKAILRDPNIGGSAILAWMLEGCLQWQEKGLGSSRQIETATDSYRADMDPLHDFIDECCILGETESAQSGDLWTAYKAWGAGGNYGEKLTQSAFYK